LRSLPDRASGRVGELAVGSAMLCKAEENIDHRGEPQPLARIIGRRTDPPWRSFDPVLHVAEGSCATLYWSGRRTPKSNGIS
jgi:hypothetical protein